MKYHSQMRPDSMLLSFFTRSVFSLCCLFGHCVVASAPLEDAKAFITIATQADGRCQNLSAGGKLAVVRNVHPQTNIRFRLIRMFVDVPQLGRATGIAVSGAPGQKLGCTLVDGREQRWVVERATFTSEAAN